MLFAYAGFENLGVPAGEYKNPRRDLPRALLVGILAIAAIYVLAQLGAMASIPNLSATKTPIASAAAEIVGPIGAIIVTLGALLSMAGTNSGTVLEGSRMLYALSLDRRMGPVSYVHPRFRTPTVAIAVHVVVAAALALGGSFAKLAMLSAVARLTTYLCPCAALPRLATPTARRWILAVLGTAISLVLYLTLDRFNFLAAAIALLVGAMVWLVSMKRGPRASEPRSRGRTPCAPTEMRRCASCP